MAPDSLRYSRPFSLETREVGDQTEPLSVAKHIEQIVGEILFELLRGRIQVGCHGRQRGPPVRARQLIDLSLGQLGSPYCAGTNILDLPALVGEARRDRGGPISENPFRRRIDLVRGLVRIS